MTEKKYQLTRRKALAGLATVGVAGAGAGLGTSALFSDTESFNNNSLTAGTLNLVVDLQIIDASGDFALAEAAGNTLGLEDSVTIDGPHEATFILNDLKPGDWWVACTTVTITGNPGYARVLASNVNQGEGDPAQTEPEDPVDSGTDPDSGLDEETDGDLGDYVQVSMGDNYNFGTGQIELAGNTSPLEFSGTLNEFLMALGADLPGQPTSWDGLTYENTSPLPPGHGDPRSPHDPTVIGPGPNADVTSVTHYTLYEIPDTVGNVIQGDTLSFDLEWQAEQWRNNPDDTPFDPGSPGTPDPPE